MKNTGEVKRITIDALEFADALKRVALCASTDMTRPILAGIRIEATGPKSLRVTAANNFIIGCAKVAVIDEDADCDATTVFSKPIVVSTVYLKQLLATLAVKASFRPAFLSLTGSPVRLAVHNVNTDLKCEVATVDGVYPIYAQVVPKEDPKGPIISFNPKLMILALQAAGKDCKVVTMRLHKMKPYGEAAPITPDRVYEAPITVAAEDYLAIVMPVRSSPARKPDLP